MEKTKYVLYLNYKENIPVVDEPFLITTSMFSGQFQNVWELWLNPYESANPIPKSDKNNKSKGKNTKLKHRYF